MTTRSKAREAFDEDWESIEALLGLQAKEGATTHAQTAAKSKAGLIFLITAWEAYVEAAAREFAEFLAVNTPTFSELPRPVRRSIEKEVKRDLAGVNDRREDGRVLAPRDLADDGWREVFQYLVTAKTESRNFNTPNGESVKGLFRNWCGIDVTESWQWERFAKPAAMNRLDKAIDERGEVVHTGKKPDGMNTDRVEKYFGNTITRLVQKTDEALFKFANEQFEQKDLTNRDSKFAQAFKE